MIHIRPADDQDELAVQELLGQLGYVFTAEEVRARLVLLATSGTDPVLLATEDSRAVGLIAMHCATMLHYRDPVARITALVVRDDVRGKGVGRILVDAGANLAEQAGCGLMELTTAVHRTESQAFYEALGFTTSSLRFHRVLKGEVVS